MTQATPASDNVTCYIRRSREWAESYRFSDEHIKVWNVEQVSATWNDLFNIRYVDFRRRLHQIQRDNFADVPFSSIINQYDYDPCVDYGRVVPTDDDDWFHPDVVAAVRESDDTLVYWNFVNFTEGVITVQDSTREAVQFESNNYAMRGVSDEMLLRYHARVNAACRNRAGTHIDRCLSMHNRTMASLGLLREQLPDLRAGMVRLYEISRSPVKVVGQVPGYFMRFVDAVVGVFKNELKIRRMFI